MRFSMEMRAIVRVAAAVGLTLLVAGPGVRGQAPPASGDVDLASSRVYVFVGKKGSDVRVAVTGAGANGVFRLPEFEAALKTRFNAKSLDGLSVPADGLNGDIHASPDYRAHLIGVMAKRAVNKALGK